MGNRATLDELYRVPGKAELVNGQVVVMSPGLFVFHAVMPGVRAPPFQGR